MDDVDVDGGRGVSGVTGISTAWVDGDKHGMRLMSERV